MGMPVTDVENNINELLIMKLIDNKNKVTKMGKEFLRTARKINIPRDNIDLNTEFYYPIQLRVPI